MDFTMNHWHFILGAYGVTVLIMLVEVVAVRARRRAALEAAQASGDHAAPAARLTGA
jgi:heme exporter protein CcmD